MASNGGERTLIPALIPPGATHIHGVYSLGLPDLPLSKLAFVAGQLSALASDFAIRVAPKSTIGAGAASRLAVLSGHALEPEVVLRTLRLQGLTEAFAPLWETSYQVARESTGWAAREVTTVELTDFSARWTPTTPLRRAIDRRQAQMEVDVMVALMFGLSAEELCTLYRTQFPVLYGYDRTSHFFDAEGRAVPNKVLATWRQKGDAITQEERTAIHPGSGVSYTYELPFVTLDREADMRRAYAHFERILQERS